MTGFCTNSTRSRNGICTKSGHSTFDVDGATDLGVVDGGGAEVALGSGPVAEIEGGGALGGAGVVSVVESRFLVLKSVRFRSAFSAQKLLL